MTKKLFYISLIANIMFYVTVVSDLFYAPYFDKGLLGQIVFLISILAIVSMVSIVALFVCTLILFFFKRDRFAIATLIINAIPTAFVLWALFFGLKPIHAQQFTHKQDTLNLGEVTPTSTFATFIQSYLNVTLDRAWEFLNTRGFNGVPVSVVVLDTGVDRQHQEFKGVDFTGSDLNALFDHEASSGGHGTQVSGIIGANNVSAISSANYIPPQMNGVLSGVHGLTYSLNEKFLGSSFDSFTELSFVPFNSIVNLSSILGPASCAIAPILAKFIRPILVLRSDSLFVVSAGETPPDDASCFTPGLLSDRGNIINVGGLDFDGEHRWPGSPSGAAVSIAAPAVGVYAPSTFVFNPPGDKYEPSFGGTSASAPLVTGVAAILKALEPEYKKSNPGLLMTPAKIKEIITKSADPIVTDKPLGSGCFDPNNNSQGFTGCRLNVFRAVVWLFPPTPVTLEKPLVVPQ